jgi:Mg-chelatase subunit ChlD
MSNIIQKPEDNNKVTTQSGNPLNSTRLGNSLQSKIHQKLREEKAIRDIALTVPNRIVLFEDCSGSMITNNKIENLRAAVESFIINCNFNDTSVCHWPFPKLNEVDELDKESYTSYTRNRGLTYKPYLTCDPNLLLVFVPNLKAKMGGTPLKQAMEDVYKDQSLPLTRGIIISDGQPTDGSNNTTKYNCIYGEIYEVADKYACGKLDSEGLTSSDSIPLDTIHIGDSKNGEEVLRKIAEITGGIYIKFTDSANFANALHYLTPANRSFLMLASAEDKKNILGCDEVK